VEAGAPMTQALDGSGATLLQGVPTGVALGTDDAPIGAISIEANGAGPWPGDDAESPRCDLVVWGDDFGMPGHTTPSGMVPALGSSSGMGPGVAGLLLLSYPGSLFPLVN
jgi:hypothetical protein